MNNKEDINLKKFFPYLLIIIGTILIFTVAFMVYNEFSGAKSFCESQEAEYSFTFPEIGHFCDGEQIFKYKEGWDFDRELLGLRITLP